MRHPNEAPKHPPGRFAERRAILAVVPQPEDEAVAAGRSAEAALRSLMRGSLAMKSARVYHSKRVPKLVGLASGQAHGGGGRFEIDLIVVTPRQITAIEIKNWSGSLRVEGSHWVQVRRGGDMLDHGPVAELIRTKLDALTTFLATKSVQLPPAQATRIMLWNPNLHLPDSLRDNPDVILRADLDRYLAAQKAPGFAGRLLNAVMSMVLEGEARDAVAKAARPLARRHMRKLHAALDTLRGFDHVALVGGKVLSGDLLGLHGRNGNERLRGLMKSGTEVDVLCKRGTLGSFLTALVGGRMTRLGRPMQAYRVHHDDVVVFQPAGQRQPEPIALAQIQRISWG